MNDNAFEMASSAVRFGAGVTREVGMDLADLTVRRALVVTDPQIANLAPVATVLQSLKENGIEFAVYDRVRVEPDYESLQDAIAFAASGGFDGYVAVGGGSTIDTAKAANLYVTYPPEHFLDYVNAPIGRGKPDLTDFVVDGLEPSDRVPRHEALSEARSSSTAD